MIGSFALLACTSCAVFGGADQSATLHTGLPPAVAAWIAAEVCRAEFPAADPLPMHAGAPAWQSGPESFLVDYRGTGRHGYRLACNVRLGPPASPLTPAGTVLRGAGVHGVVTAPVAATGFRGPWTDAVRIDVGPSVDGGAELCVALHGSASAVPVVAHLRQLIRLVEDVQSGADGIAGGDWQAVDVSATAAVKRFGSGCCARHLALAARPWLQRATAAVALDRPELATRHIAVARSSAPELHGLDRWSATLHASLGRDDLAQKAWRRHALAANDYLHRRQAAAEQRRYHVASDPDAVAARRHGQARRALQRGDRERARQVLNRARAAAPDDDQLLALLGEVFAADGDERRALEVVLVRAQRRLEPGTIVELARSWARIGNPTLGLRVLARHWPQLAAATPDSARGCLEELVEATGLELACRVLTAEQVPELAAAEMERFERRGADPLALTSLRRAAALRERSAHRAAGEMARPPK